MFYKRIYKKKPSDNTNFKVSFTVCVNNCTDHENGDFQSCYTCYEYVSCGGGVLYNRSCQDSGRDKPLVWDNIKRRCVYNSPTCDPTYILY